MIKQKVLIDNNEIKRVGNDYEIDQQDFLNQSLLRLDLPQELYGEEQRFLKYEDGQIVLDQALKTETLREEKLSVIRRLRDSKLLKADHAIFKADDVGQPTTELRAYRAQLRDFTEQFKDENGDPSPLLDDTIVEELVWPQDPSVEVVVEEEEVPLEEVPLEEVPLEEVPLEEEL
jgi:hypothetical protein